MTAEQPQDTCKALRNIAEQIPKGETVLLPDLAPAQFFDGSIEGNQEGVKFVPVNTARLLQFIADRVKA